MGKMYLPQIKTFTTEGGSTESLDKKINSYVVEVFNETGVTPKVEVGIGIVVVICNKLMNVTYGEKGNNQ